LPFHLKQKLEQGRIIENVLGFLKAMQPTEGKRGKKMITRRLEMKIKSYILVELRSNK
jgi:hypothetical protein